MKIGTMETILFQNRKLIYKQNSHNLSDLGEIWCKSSERNAVQCEFRENWRREGRIFLMGANEITF